MNRKRLSVLVVAVSAAVLVGGAAPSASANDKMCSSFGVLGVPLVKNTCVTLQDIVDDLPPGGGGGNIPLP